MACARGWGRSSSNQDAGCGRRGVAGGWGEQGRQEAIRRAGAGLGSLLHSARLAKRSLGALIVSAPRCSYRWTPPTHTHPMGLGEGTVMAEP